ncbi:MAG: aspartate aminotransferase family protein [Bacillota bacterium]|jgi:4-aminobutyrate aminotransferase-like enzyme
MTGDRAVYGKYDLLAPVRDCSPIEFVSASGAAFVGADGREYLDLSEMCKVLGQSNSAYTEAITTAVSGINSDKEGISSARARLYRYLIETTNGDFSGIHLCSSGSESVEWAVRLAKKMTGRTEVLSFWNSIHGRTYLSSSISGLPRRKAGYGPLAPGAVFAAYPRCAGCVHKGSCGDGYYECLERMKQDYRFSSAQDLAAVIVEPYQGADISIPPEGYLDALWTWAKEQGMMFIMDEIQSGLGRTGAMYCYQREDIRPDMLLLGKALGNGMHISALLVRELPEKSALPPLTGGTGDETVACAAACEVFRQLEEGLLEHVQKVSVGFLQGLRALKKCKCVFDVRGIGLVAAVEFCTEEQAAAVWRAMRERGFFTGRSGKVVHFRPPYVITEEQVNRFLVALDEVTGTCESDG